MGTAHLLALGLLLAVCVASSTRWVNRSAAAVVAALLLAVVGGLPQAWNALLPEVLLATAGLMILASSVKETGLASWLALTAAQVGRGRPGPILFSAGILVFFVAGLLGPTAAIVLLLPVVLLLAVELDISPLPFVVTLCWAALLGGASVLTALPGNLWLASALDLSSIEWFVTLLPFTGTALIATLVVATLGFRNQLRATHERRARVLEFDASRSITDPAAAVRTLLILALVVVGLILGPWVSVGPGIVCMLGAVVLRVWNTPRSGGKFLAEGEASTLVFFAGLMVVVAAATHWTALAASALSPSPLLILGTTAALGTVLDQGLVLGAFSSILQSWDAPGTPWVFAVLGSTLGAGLGTLGAASNLVALGLTGQRDRRIGWFAFTRAGLLLFTVNLLVFVALSLLLG